MSKPITSTSDPLTAIPTKAPRPTFWHTRAPQRPCPSCGSPYELHVGNGPKLERKAEGD